jgi:hypothetical protein
MPPTRSKPSDNYPDSTAYRRVSDGVPLPSFISSLASAALAKFVVVIQHP